MIEYRNLLEVGEEIQERVRLWRNSPRVRAGLIEQSDIAPEQHRRWLESLAQKTGIHEVRVAFSDGVPFGLLNLRDIDRKVSSCNPGFYIGEDSFLGKRLGLRLLYDLLEWGLAETGVYKVYSEVRADNLKVLHYNLQAGYHIEGFLKDHLRSASGELVGLYLIAQFREDWPKSREKISSWGKIGESK
jgi:RimJ/RimL family protein N-acetyltransferase